jgi:hypothetical protein
METLEYAVDISAQPPIKLIEPFFDFIFERFARPKHSEAFSNDILFG